MLPSISKEVCGKMIVVANDGAGASRAAKAG
jgi:hypothetical protein